ncbi:hypothetical protein [Paenibacillus glycanilyticus]|uniref:Uncharacterized protein n=1 Tax=Paenibacillus glycanilyticus TaxID=126569 RepID=A0ABQ6GFU4_9BACL|nr:hypothetical protein [Paenibacillus glycanilyticus]GLX68208.1 hypothetical protein MU1_25530 [Paenibacillus glycanilyticus]
MPKQLRTYILIFIALVLISTATYNHINHKWEEKYNNLKSLYQQKSESGYIYIVTHASSAIPLAQTLEKISASKENENPATIQQLLYKSQTQAKFFTEQMLTIIEFSDSFTKNTVPKISINETVMTSDFQSDMFILAFQADVWIPLHNISYSYWKSKPNQQLNAKTRETLKSFATELRALDQTINSYKETAAQMAYRGQTPYSKTPLLNQLKEHLTKLKSIQADMYK